MEGPVHHDVPVDILKDLEDRYFLRAKWKEKNEILYIIMHAYGVIVTPVLCWDVFCCGQIPAHTSGDGEATAGTRLVGGLGHLLGESLYHASKCLLVSNIVILA